MNIRLAQLPTNRISNQIKATLDINKLDVWQATYNKGKETDDWEAFDELSQKIGDLQINDMVENTAPIVLNFQDILDYTRVVANPLSTYLLSGTNLNIVEEQPQSDIYVIGYLRRKNSAVVGLEKAEALKTGSKTPVNLYTTGVALWVPAENAKRPEGYENSRDFLAYVTVYQNTVDFRAVNVQSPLFRHLIPVGEALHKSKGDNRFEIAFEKLQQIAEGADNTASLTRNLLKSLNGSFEEFIEYCEVLNYHTTYNSAREKEANTSAFGFSPIALPNRVTNMWGERQNGNRCGNIPKYFEIILHTFLGASIEIPEKGKFVFFPEKPTLTQTRRANNSLGTLAEHKDVWNKLDENNKFWADLEASEQNQAARKAKSTSEQNQITKVSPPISVPAPTVEQNQAAEQMLEEMEILSPPPGKYPKRTRKAPIKA